MKLLLLLLLPTFLFSQEDIRRSYIGKFSFENTVNMNDQYNNAVAISKTNLRYPEKLYIKAIGTKRFEGALLTYSVKESFNDKVYVSSLIGKYDYITINVLYSLDFNSYVIVKSYCTGDKIGTTCNLIFSAYGDLIQISKSIFNKTRETKFIYHL